MISSDKDSIGAALGRVPSGLFIVTIRKDEQVQAFLASWVQQASFEPPVLSVACKDGRPAAELLAAGGDFAINVIGKGEHDLMKHFGKGFEPGVNPYEGIEVQKGETGVEVLPQALSVIECRSTGERAKAGDHHLYLGEAVGGWLREGSGDPAVHIRKSGFSY